MYELIKKRMWWILFLLAIALVIGITNNLDGQIVFNPIITTDQLTYDIYENGVELKVGEALIAFIYGNEPFGFKDNGFQIILVTGDTLEIKLRGKQ